MARVTAKDVAKLAEVDPSTVSRVLNNSSPNHSYDPDTIDRIKQAATTLGYRPSSLARALRMGKTFLLGLLVANIQNEFFAELAAHVERFARDNGYRMLICNTDESGELQGSLISDLVDRAVDGLIVVPSSPDGIDLAVQRNVPVISVDRPWQLSVPHIGMDNIAAGAMLAEHLAQLGYQKLMMVSQTSVNDRSVLDRIKGFKQTGAGKSIVAHVEITKSLEDSQSITDLGDALENAGRVDAIVGLNNIATIKAYQMLTQKKLDIPGDIGLAGIDDFQAAGFMKPGITVVAQPVREIARLAVDAMLASLSDTDAIVASKSLLPTLIKRTSLKKLG